ncbi:MAG: outer membrane beta-barrel protein [Salinivenus sp.]
MQRFTVLAAFLILALGLLAPTSAEAQTSFKIGPRLGIPVGDFDDAASVYLGADARLTTEALPVVPNASFDYYFTDVDGYSLFAIDLNALYEFGVDNQAFTPYAGGGLAITRASIDSPSVSFGGQTFGGGSTSNTEVGLNIVGGARFPLGSVEPFAQLNATLGGDAQRLGITGGLLFSL